MKKILTKNEAREKIDEFFKEINLKSEKQVKKIKRLAMKYNVPLGEYRKTFCKKCFGIYGNSKVRIKKGMKIVECKNCGCVNKWRLK